MPFYDFAEIKRRVSIEDAAKILNLPLKKSGNQLRGGCPACGNDDERILALTPSRNLFYCFDAKKGGDCLALVQHITGLDVQDAAAFLSPNGEADNSPAPQPRKAAATKEVAFDAEAFAAKLEYASDTDRALLIGKYRNRNYRGHRYQSGSIAGFSYEDEHGKTVYPKTWLPDQAANVHYLKRPA